jgi:hypothetical protein
MQLLNALAPLISAGMVNPKAILDRVASAFNMNPEALLAQQPQGPQAAPTAAPQNGQQLLNGAQMPAVVGNAIQGVR